MIKHYRRDPSFCHTRKWLSAMNYITSHVIEAMHTLPGSVAFGSVLWLVTEALRRQQKDTVWATVNDLYMNI
jgi:hypothetical protein